MVANDVKLIRGQTEVMQPMAAGAYALFCSAQPYYGADDDRQRDQKFKSRSPRSVADGIG